MFLAPKGPDQTDPEAEREWGLQESGCCRRGASMTKGPWDAGLQVFPDRACHTCGTKAN